MKPKGAETGEKKTPIREINVNHIKLSGVRGALILVRMGKRTPAALVDMGTTPSCLSGAQYREMVEPLLSAFCKGTIQAATEEIWAQ